MPDFITLAYPSCGGKLQITPDLDRFACAHCGSEHLVRRGGAFIRQPIESLLVRDRLYVLMASSIFLAGAPRLVTLSPC